MRLLRNDQGEQLVRCVTLKLFFPGNKKRKQYVVRAPSKKGITPSGVEDILKRAAESIERDLPGYEYHLVPVGPAAFNFVCLGEKPKLQESA